MAEGKAVARVNGWPMREADEGSPSLGAIQMTLASGACLVVDAKGSQKDSIKMLARSYRKGGMAPAGNRKAQGQSARGRG